MGDYYTSWKRKGVGIYQRTVSYRSGKPKGSRSRTSRASSEERLEQNSSLYAKAQLYSDLYAQAGNGETYNPEDTGHEFITQVWKCRRYDGPFFWYDDSTSWYEDSLPKQGWMGLSPGLWGAYASWGSHLDLLGGADRSLFSDEETDKIVSAIGGSIQDTLWAQCPDDIKGSLGQDVVDVLDFGKQLDQLLTLRRRGVSLYRQYLNFSAKHRRQIDELVSKMRNSPATGAKALASHASRGYIAWVFQYLPWLEDLRTVLRVATSGYLRTVGRTRQRSIRSLTKAVNSLLDPDDGQQWMYFYPELDHLDPHNIPPKEAEDHTYVEVGLQPDDVLRNLTFRVTASVVSVWQRTFEHGVAEPLYELNQQLGLVYPSLVWDLIPWTWLIDWFVNVGKFVNRAWERGYGEWNCSYAYVTTKLGAMYAGMSYFQTCRWHISPQNGLGRMKSDQLSPSQWSILTALGLSHRN